MKDDLSKVAAIILLGRRTVRMIQTNIGFALGVKAIFLALAVTGHDTLWMAILADTGQHSLSSPMHCDCGGHKFQKIILP